MYQVDWKVGRQMGRYCGQRDLRYIMAQCCYFTFSRLLSKIPFHVFCEWKGMYSYMYSTPVISLPHGIAEFHRDKNAGIIPSPYEFT